MPGDKNFYLEMKSAERALVWLRPAWTRSAAQGLDLVEDRIRVRRRKPPMRPLAPPWLVRSILTTIVIAAIGFALQSLFLPSYAGANGATAANRWTATMPGSAGPDFQTGSLALAVLAPEQQALQPISRQAAIALNDAIPFSSAPIPAAAPFVLASTDEQDRDRAVGCLARAIYFEAGGDTVEDQRAVAQVVLNRVRHPLFPKTVCGVVFQGSQLKTGCQFTFTCDGAMARAPEPRAWARARTMAVEALNGAVFAPVGYATHFHTPWVAPYWAPTLDKIAKVGGHLFYRWPGGAGAPRAFTARYAGGEMASNSAGAVLETAAQTSAAATTAPAMSLDAGAAEPRKIAVASLELPMAAATVDRRAPLVVAPPSIVLAGGPSVVIQSYHPPIPRGGSAQPLLSRDR